MITIARKCRICWALGIFLALIWISVYCYWPKLTFDDGPFFAEPYSGNLSDLALLSSCNLSWMGVSVFVLETRTIHDPDPNTVFILKSSNGDIHWAKVTSTDFGRIKIIDRSVRWFPVGGWVVAIQPEKTEAGELYLSPLGEFRFFFHSW